MPTVTNRGIDLGYATDGPDDAETVVFVEEAGLGAWLWAWQQPAVAGRFRTVVPDLPGTGRSAAPDGSFDVADLAADLAAVLADVGAGRVHVVGAGLGGMVALEYALTADRAATLTLFGTAAAGDSLADPGALCAAPGDPAALRNSLSALLSASFRSSQPDVVDGIVDWRADDDPDPAACRRQVAAMERFDRRDRLYEVTLPALVVHGTDDRVVPLAAGRRLAEGLPRGTFEAHDGAGHLVGVERSRPVNDRLWAFLGDHARDDWPG